MTSRRDGGELGAFSHGLMAAIGGLALSWATGGTWAVGAPAVAAPMSPSAVPAAASQADRLQARIAELIKTLGSDQYQVRQHAQEELRRLGPAAFDALAAVENDRDIEIASSARYLMQLIRVDWVQDSDSPRVKNILKDYDFVDESQRQLKLTELARLPQAIGLEPLCRLVRFEQSALVSKVGALLVLEQTEKSGHDWWQARSKIIDNTLAGSQRPGARWLLAYAKFDADPSGALSDWQRLVDEELASMNSFPTDAELEIAQGLQRQQVEMLFRQNQPEKARQVVRKMIERTPDDAESLERLVDWLVKQKSLEMVDELAKRFEHRLKTSPGLIYAVAQARRGEGKQQEAEELAQRACELLGNNSGQHCLVGRRLQRRGLFDWSERELRRSIACAGDEHLDDVFAARYYLADLLFDLEREYEAAETLQKLTEILPARNEDGMVGRLSIRAKMHYYFACHYEKVKAEPKKIRQALENGLKFDHSDADILIRLYRLSADDPAYRKQIVEKIAAAAEEFRNAITQSSMEDPDEQATPYNQYAWLIGNTEGNYDLAIEYSHKSLELVPDSAGYLDTLAHCYAGKGDFKSAVRYQSRAVELEPNMLELQRSLNRFKAGVEKLDSAKGDQ